MSETNDPARIVADEANSEQAKARRVLDADEIERLEAGSVALAAFADQLSQEASGLRAKNDRLRTENKRLRADNAALRAIAQAVADGRLRGGSREEVWCCALPYDEALGRFVHTADCPERKARALLADTPPTRSDATQWNNDE